MTIDASNLLLIFGAISSSLSAFAAIAALIVAMLLHRSNQLTAARPLLVFVMVANRRWELRNIGNGPAVSIKVRDQSESGIEVVANCSPIGAGGASDLYWLEHQWGLSALYTDFYGREFVTACSNSENRIEKRANGQSWDVTTQDWYEKLREYRAELWPKLEGKSAWELDILRNEIFARHGYIFTRKDLQEHFKKQPWYEPKFYSLDDLHVPASEKTRANAIFQFQKQADLLTSH